MKKLIRNSIVFTAILSVFFTSCAEDTEDYDQVSIYETMDKWMKKNKPDIGFIDSGYYYTIYPNHEEGDKLIPVDSTLVEMLITGKTLSGDYFLNSYDSIARKLNSFSYKTRYVPFRYIIENYPLYNFTNVGVSNTLMKMKRGDSAVVFLAPKYSYGDISTPLKQLLGFGGSKYFLNGDISQYTIVLKGIEVSPGDTALNQVLDYAKDVLEIPLADSVKKGLYVKRLDSLGGGEFIGEKDTTLSIWYKGYFLDGFVFDTNIEEVARENNIYNANMKYAPMSYNINKKDDETNDGNIISFKYGLAKLKPGDKSTLLTIPEWAYGAMGEHVADMTVIPIYTPILFDIEIIAPK